ncbi:MAG: hypothetical protein AAGG51_07650 [Cyanobacteria bacterium P01_G01_bin.54]
MARTVDQSSRNLTPLKCDVLLVTVTSVESSAVLNTTEKVTGAGYQPDYSNPNNVYYHLGVIGDTRVAMVRSEMGSGGAGGSLLTVKEAIQDLEPAAVIGVGIAFGMKPDRQEIGDILISKQLQDYEPRRESTDTANNSQTISRGCRVEASPGLLSKFREGELSWQDCELRFGLLLTGSALVDNREFRDQLLQQWPEAIGGEMEGSGIYSAAFLHNVHWIVVKAICDWADGNKKVNDEDARQKKAAKNAATFVVSVLQRGGLARKEFQHQSGDILDNSDPESDGMETYQGSQDRNIDLASKAEQQSPDAKTLKVLYHYYQKHKGDPKMNLDDLVESSGIVREEVVEILRALKENSWVEYRLTEGAEMGSVEITPAGVKVAKGV